MNQPNQTLPRVFAFDSAAVRVVHLNGEPWFVAKDVCAALGVQNHRGAVARLDDDEKVGVGIADALGREQQTTVINESGLYSLILRSHGATTAGQPAHTFRKWLMAEVLPALGKTGSYGAAPVPMPTPMAELDARMGRVLDLLEQTLQMLPPEACMADADSLQPAATVFALARMLTKACEGLPADATLQTIALRALGDTHSPLHSFDAMTLATRIEDAAMALGAALCDQAKDAP